MSTTVAGSYICNLLTEISWCLEPSCVWFTQCCYCRSFCCNVLVKMSFVRVGRLVPRIAQHSARVLSAQMTRGYAQMAFTFASSSNVRRSPWYWAISQSLFSVSFYANRTWVAETECQIYAHYFGAFLDSRGDNMLCIIILSLTQTLNLNPTIYLTETCPTLKIWRQSSYPFPSYKLTYTQSALYVELWTPGKLLFVQYD